MRGELVASRLARQSEGSGPGSGRIGHAFVPAVRAADGERVQAVGGSMERDHPEWALEPGLSGSPETGDCPEHAHGLGMKRGETASHPCPAGHPGDTSPSIRVREAGEERVDQVARTAGGRVLALRGAQPRGCAGLCLTIDSSTVYAAQEWPGGRCKRRRF
jgi:hypothetical protein